MNTTTNAALIAALEDAARAINSMKVEAETAAQGDEQMMLEACEQISNEGLAASEAIRAALASTAAQPPAGWVMVPVEPTDAMIVHAHQVCDGTHAGDVYRAMIAAAPKAEPADPLQQLTELSEQAGLYDADFGKPAVAPAAPAAADKQLADALDSLAFYRRRCELLQSWQSKMRDPERTIVCDILANGQILLGPDGQPDAGRYAEAAPAAFSLPCGWSFDVKRSDGRVWLTISTPHGARATLSAAEKTGNGDETIVAQVLGHLADSLATPTAQSAPVTQGDADKRDAREETSIGKAVNRAALDLPEGWEIRIDLARHAGTVHLIDPEGSETMIEGGGDPFSDQISTAIDAARSQAKEGGEA
jgi:hypothetical protein